MTATTINLTPSKTPSHRAIAISQRNAAKVETFTIKQSVSVPHHYFHIGAESEYLLRIDPINGAYSCDCPFYQTEGVCKHCYRLAEEVATLARLAEMEAMDDARTEEEAWAIWDGLRREEVLAAFLTAPATIQGQAGPCDNCGAYPFDDIDGEPLDYCTNCEGNALGATRKTLR